MDQPHHDHMAMDPQMIRRRYGMLGINLALSLAIMYFAMFAMIYAWDEFIQNLNFFYMALVMWVPMAAVMLLTMRSMYRNTRLRSREPRSRVRTVSAIRLVGCRWTRRASRTRSG